MDTVIVKIDVNGKRYNKSGEEIINCIYCGNNTTMLGTKLCDFCWEKNRHND